MVSRRGDVLRQWLARRWIHLSLMAIFLVAFLYRLQLSFRPQFYTFDSYYYLVLSRNLLRGFSYSFKGVAHAKYLPMYPMCISIFTVFLRNGEWAGKLVNSLSFSLAVFPLYGIGKNMFGRRAGLLGCLFFALEPLAVTWATIPMSEGISILLLCLSLYLFTLWFNGREDKFLYWACFTGGLLALARWEGWLVLAIIYLVLIYRIWRWGTSWKKLLLPTAIFILPYLPWLIRNFVVFGNPFKTTYAGEIQAYSESMSIPLAWVRLNDTSSSAISRL